MRKTLPVLMLTLCLILFVGTACAQSLQMAPISASCELEEGYIILTPENLDLHTEWMENHHTTAETMQSEFALRGVLAQAWTTDDSVCVEFTAVQDEWAKQYYDLDQQDTSIRGKFRKAYEDGTAFGNEIGYKVQEAEWKKTSQYGRFLMLKYKRTQGEDVYRGFARATVRNGYHIRINLQVFGRNLTNNDLNTLNRIMNTWQFSQTDELPSIVTTRSIEFTQLPPLETNTGKFTVSGVSEPGIRLVAVILRMSSAEPTVLETTASSKGKFSFDNIKLPSEGIWLMTVTAMSGDTEIGEYVLNTITYQQNLLTVNFDANGGLDMTSSLTQTILGDQTIISGTTLGQVNIQCLIDGPTTYTQTIKTNNSGKFSFKFDSSNEGTYSIVLAMTKKNANGRRFAIEATRTVTQEDLKARAKSTAIKPSYSTLMDKLNGYSGKIMVYPLYVTQIQQAGDEWILTMALRRSKNGDYSNIMIVRTSEEPNLTIDSIHTMYGTCTGPYVVEGEENNTTYPGFDLIFFEN